MYYGNYVTAFTIFELYYFKFNSANCILFFFLHIFYVNIV